VAQIHETLLRAIVSVPGVCDSAYGFKSSVSCDVFPNRIFESRALFFQSVCTERPTFLFIRLLLLKHNDPVSFYLLIMLWTAVLCGYVTLCDVSWDSFLLLHRVFK
jgi:hypothetical protein